jgi:hypothetical protein
VALAFRFRRPGGEPVPVEAARFVRTTPLKLLSWGTFFRRSAVVAAPICWISSRPTEIRSEPTGCSPRMLVPVTTTSARLVSLSLLAAVCASAGPAAKQAEATVAKQPWVAAAHRVVAPAQPVAVCRSMVSPCGCVARVCARRPGAALGSAGAEATLP